MDGWTDRRTNVMSIARQSVLTNASGAENNMGYDIKFKIALILSRITFSFTSPIPYVITLLHIIVM